MHRFSTPIAGRIYASLAAGPIFLLSYVFTRMATNPVPLSDTGPPPVGIVIMLLLVAAPAGFLVSVLPISLSALLMTRMGRYEPEIRAPFLWAATGGALGIAISVAISMGLNHADRPDLILATAASVPGVACALICRIFARWDPI
jgi:hypothetical protein